MMAHSLLELKRLLPSPFTIWDRYTRLESNQLSSPYKSDAAIRLASEVKDASRGFEPRSGDSKAPVLPLDDRAIRGERPDSNRRRLGHSEMCYHYTTLTMRYARVDSNHHLVG